MRKKLRFLGAEGKVVSELCLGLHCCQSIHLSALIANFRRAGTYLPARSPSLAKETKSLDQHILPILG